MTMMPSRCTTSALRAMATPMLLRLLLQAKVTTAKDDKAKKEADSKKEENEKKLEDVRSHRPAFLSLAALC